MKTSLLSPQSMQAYRLALGALVLWSVAQRAVEFHLLLGPWSALPIGAAALLHEVYALPLPASQLFWTLVLVVGAIAGLLILDGRRLIVGSTLALVVLVLLHLHNPATEYGADRVLRIQVLFLLLFAAFSCRGDHGAPRVAILITELLFVLQLVAIYFVTVLNRDWQVWWYDGIALKQALHFDVFSTSLGRWLVSSHELSVFLTRAATLVELLGPVLLVCLWSFWRMRIALVVTFVGFHILIGLSLGLFYFTCVMAAYWIAMLPQHSWSPRNSRFSQLRGRELIAEGRRSLASGIIGVLAGALLLGSAFARDPIERGSDITWRERLFTLGIHQRWRFFSPYPSRDDGWFVALSSDAEGRPIDLLRNVVLDPVTAEGFRRLPRASLRHRYLQIQLRTLARPSLYALWVRSLCQSRFVGFRKPYNSLVHVTFWSEVTSVDGSEPELEEVRIGTFWCSIASGEA